jgi:transposase
LLKNIGYEWCFEPKIIALNKRIKGKEVIFVAYNPYSHKILRKYFPDMSKESFYKFIIFLLKKEKEDIYLILDNHPSHKSLFEKEIFKEGRIKPVWLPKNAPELNDIDKIIFNLIRREVLNNRAFNSLKEVEVAIDKWIKEFNSNKIAISLQN